MDTVEKAVDRFYKALNELFVGDMQGMIDLWSHSSEASYLGPQGEIIVGWDKIKPTFQAQANLHLKGTITPTDIHIFTHQDIAMTQNYEIGNNEVDGKPVTVKIRAMNLFRKENNVWKMISHQTDLLPFL